MKEFFCNKFSKDKRPEVSFVTFLRVLRPQTGGISLILFQKNIENYDYVLFFSML